MKAPCSDPKSFVRGGPIFFFLVDEGERIQIPLKAGHHQHIRETPFKWHLAGGPIMAQQCRALACYCFIIFQGIRTSIAKINPIAL